MSKLEAMSTSLSLKALSLTEVLALSIFVSLCNWTLSTLLVDTIRALLGLARMPKIWETAVLATVLLVILYMTILLSKSLDLTGGSGVWTRLPAPVPDPPADDSEPVQAAGISEIPSDSARRRLLDAVYDPPARGECETKRAAMPSLPMFADADKLMEAIGLPGSRTIIVSGTGSGKTVIAPKVAALLGGHVVVTNPKRLSTENNAMYSAEIECTTPAAAGGAPKDIGYSHSLSNSRGQRITYATDGYVLGMAAGGDLTRYCDTLIVDEVHERSVPTDMLLESARSVAGLRLILMSATMDTALVERWLSDGPGEPVRVIYASGRPNKPFRVVYRDPKYYSGGGGATMLRAAAMTVAEIHSKRPDSTDGVLVFVASKREAEMGALIMAEVCETQGIDLFSAAGRGIEPMVLYSGMAAGDQGKATEELKDRRKVVFSTNIAESSVTLDGIRYVIDGGTKVQVSYSPTRDASSATVVQISKAEATQRAGRVGRNSTGVVVRMYPGPTYSRMATYPPAPITTIDLSGHFAALLTTASYPDAKARLSSLMTPVSAEQLAAADSLLRYFGIVENEMPTAVGMAVANVVKSANVSVECAVGLIACASGNGNRAVQDAAVVQFATYIAASETIAHASGAAATMAGIASDHIDFMIEGDNRIDEIRERLDEITQAALRVGTAVVVPATWPWAMPTPYPDIVEYAAVLRAVAVAGSYRACHQGVRYTPAVENVRATGSSSCLRSLSELRLPSGDHCFLGFDFVDSGDHVRHRHSTAVPVERWAQMT